MYPNLAQPFIEFTHAQANTVARFAKSPDIAEFTRSSIENFWRLLQENHSRLVESNAFAQWTAANLENFARFAQDYSRTVAAVALQTQSELTRGIQERSRRFQKVANTAIHAAGDELPKR